jgi:hypothetical protein
MHERRFVEPLEEVEDDQVSNGTAHQLGNKQ